jgi:CubicO group peptidase (beta-lactamase class C family)
MPDMAWSDKMRCVLISILFFTVLAAAADLTKSPVADRIHDYVSVFNSGDTTAIREWIAGNYADSVLALRSPAQRMVNFTRMLSNMQHIELQRVLAAEAGHTLTLMHTAVDEWFQFDFINDPRQPHKLYGLMVQPAGEPEDSSAAPLREKTALDSTKKLLDRLVKADQFSGVVLVAKDGQSVFQKAYGYADRAAQIKNDLDTRFNLGSIDKSFTRIAIERLIADGKLTADQKVGDILPDYPNKSVRSKVTVQQLLDHKAGVPDFFGDEFVQSAKDRIRTLADYLPFFAEKPLEFEPGSQEKYSNGGFVILGLIIENVTGRSYYDYIRDTIFAPLEMAHSDWYDDDQIVPHRAVGYTHRWNGAPQESKEWRSNELMQPARGSSAGGSYATADDLLKFVNALEQGKLKSSEGPGLGIAGGSPGVNAAIESGIRGGYTVIVLSNLDPPAAERPAAKIRRWFAHTQK